MLFNVKNTVLMLNFLNALILDMKNKSTFIVEPKVCVLYVGLIGMSALYLLNVTIQHPFTASTEGWFYTGTKYLFNHMAIINHYD